MNMKITTTEVREVECGSARLLQVIETKFARGTDEPGDPVREVTQYWSTDGQLLAENEKPLDSVSTTEKRYQKLLGRAKMYHKQLDIVESPTTSSCEVPSRLLERLAEAPGE